MADDNGVPERIHLSKRSVELWERCPLAYKYDRVDRLAKDDSVTPGQLRGIAAHEVTAGVLKAKVDPGSDEATNIVDSVLGTYLLEHGDATQVADLALGAVDYILGLGGRVRWIEVLAAMRTAKDVIVWGRFDAAVVGGRLAPMQVIDLKFGNGGCSTPEQLEESSAGRMYTLLARHIERDPDRQPIAVSEVNLVHRREVVIWPSDKQAAEWRTWLRAITEEIRTARRQNRFPASPGEHCSWCSFNRHCPAATPCR